jgi:glycerol-3-phosphate dehydrogenase
MDFSSKEREAALQSLETRPAELLIIGGGIVGCSLAAHASQLGLNCVLLERSDLASGASGYSTGLAHAGLRYLAQGRVRYVLHEARERLRLEQLAPHWVRPFSFLFPVYKGDPFRLPLVNLGTAIYDRLYRFALRSVPQGKISSGYRRVSRDELFQRIPGLASGGLAGGTEYFVDARLSDCRFTLGFAQKAASNGARVITYAPVESFTNDRRRLDGILGKDRVSGRPLHLKARLIVNATGGWIDVIRQLAGLSGRVLRNSKGIHLIVDRLAETPLILSTHIRGQVFFVLPIGKRLSLVGTTDTPLEGSPDDVRPTGADVSELVEHLFRFFPDVRAIGTTPEHASLIYQREHVHEVYWGVRPLLSGGRSTIHASREHRLIKESNGLWSVPGVKLTAGRAAGEEVAREAWRALRTSPCPAKTVETLPGGEFSDFGSFVKRAQARTPNLSEDALKYLIGRYGTRYGEVLAWVAKDPSYGERVHPEEEWLYAEAAYAAHQEMVLTLNDFLWRRSRWARLRELPEEVLLRITHILAGELGWSSLEERRQISDFKEELRIHRLR